MAPYGDDGPQVGDIVLVKVRGQAYLHLVKARQGGRYLIGNNRGGLNGWVGRAAIFGRAVRVDSPRKHRRQPVQERR